MLMRSPLARDRRTPPGFIRPCQPVLSAKVPIGDGWIHELKHDGFRIVALKAGDDVRLWSRHGRNWSAEFVADHRRSDGEEPFGATDQRVFFVDRPGPGLECNS